MQDVESALARNPMGDVASHYSTADTTKVPDCIGELVAVIAMHTACPYQREILRGYSVNSEGRGMSKRKILS